MKKFTALLLALVMCLSLLSACGGTGDVPNQSGSPAPTQSGEAQTPESEIPVESDHPEVKPEPQGTVDVAWETGAVTVEYYEGAEIVQTEQEGNLLIQVPQGAYLESITIFAPEGKVEVIGVLAALYDIETVGHDIDIYLPEGTAFHVMLSTIRDIFESDFPYDVTMTKHEYIYLTDGVEIVLETIIGIARVMMLK